MVELGRVERAGPRGHVAQFAMWAQGGRTDGANCVVLGAWPLIE